MTKIKDILDHFDALAPAKTADEGDNVGLLIGDARRSVKKVLICLDVSNAVVDEAVSGEFDLILSHHSVIFEPLSAISAADPVGRRAMKLIENAVSVISVHTNMDYAENGVSRQLARRLELSDVRPLKIEKTDACVKEKNIGCTGNLKKPLMTLDFVNFVKHALNAPALRFAGGEKMIKTVALVAGSGMDYIFDAVKSGADAFLTADVKYHSWPIALEHSIVIADAGHFYTESGVRDVFKEEFGKHFKDIDAVVSSADIDPVSYI